MGGGGSKKTQMNPNVVTIHHFQMETVIGRGGYGTVTAATRTADTPAGKKDEWYAIKTLSKAAIAGEHGGIDSIMNERDILASVSSPFIVNMVHAFTDDTHCYLVLDLCLAGDLDYHMRCSQNAVFKEDRMKFYIASVAVALEACHERNILHRDVKPENIVMDSEGFVRLTDFGISCQTTDLTCTQSSGTPMYMSPESLSKGREHGAASDFYSLGCCAYKFGTSVCPFLPHVSAQAISFIRTKSAKKGKTLGNKKMLPDWDLLKVAYSDEAKDLIRILLDPRPWERISSVEGLKTHPLYTGFNWIRVYNKTGKPPYTPDITKANNDTVEEPAFFGERAKRAGFTSKISERFRHYDYRTQWGTSGGGPTGDAYR
jgi:serine/threonine protein kinase